jgi:hypothetical protein
MAATRIQLNSGIDALGQTANIVDALVANLYTSVSLNVGSLFVVSVAHGNKGANIQIPVSLLKGHGSISALQFDLLLPAGITYQSVTTGAAALSAQKSATGATVTGGVRILIFGLNQNIISNGILATLQFHLETSLTLGYYSIPISGIVSSDPNGLVVPTMGLTGAVLIP